MRSYSGLALALLLVRMAQGQANPLSSRQYCEMVAGDGISLTQMPAQEPLRPDLILQALRFCPEEFVSIASNFPIPNPVLRGLSGLEKSDALTGSLAKDAIERIKSTSSLRGSAFARSLIEALSKNGRSSADSRTLVRAEQRDSRILAELAGTQKDRTGDKQEILLAGTFIMWVANRVELNLAFQMNPASLEWLRPYPPSVGLVGPAGDTTKFDELAAAIVNRASQFTGPIDNWFRRFKVER